MIVKLQKVPGYKIISDVVEVKTGYFDIENAICRYARVSETDTALVNEKGEKLEKKYQDSNMLFHVIYCEFSGNEIQNGMCHNYSRLEEPNDYKRHAVAITVKTKNSEDTYISNQQIYLMNDNGETIERIN